MTRGKTGRNEARETKRENIVAMHVTQEEEDTMRPHNFVFATRKRTTSRAVIEKRIGMCVCVEKDEGE